MRRLTAPSSESARSHTHATRTNERKPRPSAGVWGSDFGDRILAIIYASRAYGFHLYGAYECLSAKINGQFVGAHCRR